MTLQTVRTDVIRVTVYPIAMQDRATVEYAKLELLDDYRPAATLVEGSARIAPAYRAEIEFGEDELDRLFMTSPAEAPAFQGPTAAGQGSAR